VKPVDPYLLLLIGVLGVAGLTAGVILALSGYSSAGPFAIASACVAVLTTLAAEGRVHRNGRSHDMARPESNHDMPGDES